MTRMTVDTTVGMLFSNIIAYFIIVAPASTLHAHGITQIQTAAQAAEALPSFRKRLASTRSSMGASFCLVRIPTSVAILFLLRRASIEESDWSKAQGLYH